MSPCRQPLSCSGHHEFAVISTCGVSGERIAFTAEDDSQKLEARGYRTKPRAPTQSLCNGYFGSNSEFLCIPVTCSPVRFKRSFQVHLSTIQTLTRGPQGGLCCAAHANTSNCTSESADTFCPRSECRDITSAVGNAHFPPQATVEWWGRSVAKGQKLPEKVRKSAWASFRGAAVSTPHQAPGWSTAREAVWLLMLCVPSLCPLPLAQLIPPCLVTHNSQQFSPLGRCAPSRHSATFGDI